LFLRVVRKDVNQSNGVGGQLVIGFDELFFLHVVEVLDHGAGDRFGNIVVEGGVGYNVVGWSREEKNAVFFQFGHWSERW
jgi:hypothetical protein